MKTLIVVALFALACGRQSESEPSATQPQPQPAAPQAAAPAPSPASAVSEHTIQVNGEFTPASVTVAAGKPVKLHFRRTDSPTCADEVVFADLGIRQKLAPNATTTVELPAQDGKTLRFACGMNMMKGTVVVQ